MSCLGMLKTIELIVLASVHITARIRGPNASITNGKEDGGRTNFEFVQPVAIFETTILVPPSTLIFGPVLAATVAEQERVLVVVEFHLVVAPPSKWVKRRIDSPFFRINI